MTWERATLGDVCRKVVKCDPVSTGRARIRYIDIGGIDGTLHRLGDVPEIDSVGAPSRCRQIVAAGDTVFSTVRPYLEKIAYVDGSLDGEFASTGFSVLRPGPRLEPKFLYYFTISQEMFDQVLPYQKGVSYPAVLDREVRSVSMPVPPLEEQRRIVAILEDHLSRLDAADAYLAVTERRLAALQDRLIGRAVTGADFGAATPSGLPAVGTDDGPLPPLPTGWNWARLGDVADVVGGLTKDAKKQNDPSFIEVPYLRVANVQRGHLNLDTVTTIWVPPAKAEALRLRRGDVLLNEGGDRDKLARGWVWDGQIDDCIHQNHVFRARITDPRLTPEFLSFTANSFGGPWAERNGKQSVNLASISLKVIRQMPVIVPARGEAEAAVSRLTEQLAGTACLRTGIDAARVRCTALRRSLLDAAFSGRLTGSSPAMSAIEGRIEA